MVLLTSALRNVHIVTQKLDLDQTSVTHMHTEDTNRIKLAGTL